MAYPQIVDYNEAVQNPRTAFHDAELKGGRVKENNLGLPLALSGGFALTYNLTSAGGRKLAIRCFHRQIPEAEARYSLISNCLKMLNSGYFVDFAYQPQGIKVRQVDYPIVRMEWVDGDTLGQFLERSAHNVTAVGQLRNSFHQLSSYLHQRGIAHGDIQNDNVMFSGGKLRLVDYDGMYVPGMPLGQGTELGHKHFQHPKRSEKHFGPVMDRFSFICVDLSLQAIMADPSLHDRFKEGGNTIIFKANDLARPASSDVFTKLRSIQATKQQSEWFASICQADLSAVPTLEDFLVGRNIPAMTLTIAEPERKNRQVYIPAFPVLDASDFGAAIRFIGQRIELIGMIQEVKPGSSRKGPYIFINFGPWKGEIVKITIWSEGLDNLTMVPDRSWHGQWVSVTGLVEPPYHSARYGYTHVGVTVTAQSQIQRINHVEAMYRLGAESGASSERPDNTSILTTIKTGTSRAPAPSRMPVYVPKPSTPNQAVLASINKSRGGSIYQTSQPVSQPSVNKPSSNCFIATAVFEDADSPYVQYLRSYRDDVMAANPIGRLLIKGYATIGPLLSRVVNTHPSSRIILLPTLIKIAVYLNNRGRRRQKERQS